MFFVAFTNLLLSFLGLRLIGFFSPAGFNTFPSSLVVFLLQELTVTFSTDCSVFAAFMGL